VGSIIEREDFQKEIDNNFWLAITKKVWYKDIVLNSDLQKGKVVNDIVDQLINFEYNFKTPLYYFVPKGKGVLRTIKVFNIHDLCIYYYCVKKLQNELTVKIRENQNVFGGFKFSHDNQSITQKKIRQQKEEICNLDWYDYEYETFLSKYQFRKEWTDYQNLAKEAFEEGFDFYIHIDIAHFYDDINLDILEKEIRNTVSDKTQIIDLLLHFLRLSDKRDLGYTTTNVGIPQEEIGEMSRVLANFYLVNYDNKIINFLNEYLGEGKYEYLRYSDDMWIFYNGDKFDAYKIVQQASLYLNNLKLHVNESKIKILNSKEFNQYWHFDTWDIIHSNSTNTQTILNIFKDTLKNGQGRRDSIVKYTLKLLLSEQKKLKYSFSKNDLRHMVLTIIKNPSLVDSFDDDQIKVIAKIVKDDKVLLNQLKTYLLAKNNIFLNVEFFIIKIFTEIESDIELANFLIKFLTPKNASRHWYSKCLCIKFFIKHQTLIDRYTYLQAKIITVLEANIALICNRIERRHFIFYLYKNGGSGGNLLLNKLFEKPGDLAFINFINKNNL